MSYSAEVSFKKVENCIVMNSFLGELKKLACEDVIIKEIAMDECYYSPFFRFHSNYKDFSLRQITKDNAMILWVTNLFTFRWTFVKVIENETCDYLALFGIPRPLKKHFNGCVYFQNSCDQDYEKEEYDGLRAFENILDRYMNIPDAIIYEKLKEYDLWQEDDGGIEIDDYMRRTLAYNVISAPIVSALYDDSHSTNISLFRYYSDTLEIQKYIKEIVNLYH